MLIIPAIDLKDGKCVRLKQGRMEDDTVFSDDPVATAQHWVNEGARRLHLVDLNGAFAGLLASGAAFLTLRLILDSSLIRFDLLWRRPAVSAMTMS